MRASSPWAIVMLSTRLTGSSTSMTSASMRSARSTGVSAPGRANTRAANARDASSRAAGAGSSSAATPASSRSKNAPRTSSSPSPGALEHRRVPVVAAEHLVGALAGLHDLAVARDRLRRAGRTRRRRARPSARSSRAIACGQRLHQPLGSTRIWRWSVPNSRATRSENANSSPSRPPASGKPIENVARPRWPCSASSATIRLESSPPESSTPTGTSATIRRCTATRSASSSASSQSSSTAVAPGRARTAGPSSAARGGARPARSTAAWPAASLRTPRRIVRGAGTIACQLR